MRAEALAILHRIIGDAPERRELLRELEASVEHSIVRHNEIMNSGISRRLRKRAHMLTGQDYMPSGAPQMPMVSRPASIGLNQPTPHTVCVWSVACKQVLGQQLMMAPGPGPMLAQPDQPGGPSSVFPARGVALSTMHLDPSQQFMTGLLPMPPVRAALLALRSALSCAPVHRDAHQGLP